MANKPPDRHPGIYPSALPSGQAPETEAKTQADTSRKSLKAVEDRLRDINEQLHYTGQYLANKPVYAQFCRSKNKGRFRQEHSSEIALYEAALKFLKGRPSHDTAGGNATYKLPSLKVLKAEKERLMEEKMPEKKHTATAAITKRNWTLSAPTLTQSWARHGYGSGKKK